MRLSKAKIASKRKFIFRNEKNNLFIYPEHFFNNFFIDTGI